MSGDSGGRLAVLEVEIPPRTLVKPHSHAREDEFSLVLSGTVGVRTGDRVSEAGPGAYLVKPRGVPHAMWNAGSTPATVAEILSPAGLGEYFEKLAPIRSGGSRRSPGYIWSDTKFGAALYLRANGGRSR